MNLTPESINRLYLQLRADFGPVICGALEDKEVTGIKVGERGEVWLKKHVVKWQPTGEVLDVGQRTRALGTMAALLGKTINQKTPDLSGELPLTGDRVQGSVFPSSQEPSFVIRIHAPEVFTIDDYMEKGILQEWQANVLIEAIHTRKNIVISGAVDSGKTTLVNACFRLFDLTSEHLVIIEDTQELQCNAPNISRKKAGDPPCTMRDQIKAALRMDYDRLIIGETRGREGYDLLNAWVRGKRGGLTTIHADNAIGVLDRFAQFTEEAGVPVSWRLIRNALDVICHIEMTPQGRRVTEIMEVQKEHRTDEIPVGLKRLGPE